MLTNIGTITVQVSDQDKASLGRATPGDLVPANSVNKGLRRFTTLISKCTD